MTSEPATCAGSGRQTILAGGTATTVACAACGRSVSINQATGRVRHHTVTPKAAPKAQTGPQRSERTQAIIAYLRERSVNGVSTATWVSVAREFGCTVEWVRQNAMREGIATVREKRLTVRVCPDCGGRQNLVRWEGTVEVERLCFPCQHAKKVITLTCAACDAEFQLSGVQRSAYLRNRRKAHASDRKAFCPTCVTARVNYHKFGRKSAGGD